jgi:hypothetical protein
MQIVWSHTGSGPGNANGVAWFGVGSGGLGDAIAGGGYAYVPASGNGSETDGTSAQGLFPIVATYPVFDSNHNEWDLQIGFAVPHGLSVSAHLWVAVA